MLTCVRGEVLTCVHDEMLACVRDAHMCAGCSHVCGMLTCVHDAHMCASRRYKSNMLVNFPSQDIPEQLCSSNRRANLGGLANS